MYIGESDIMWYLAGACVLIFAWLCLWRPVRQMSREVQFAKARKFFHTQRERLEAKFVCLAARRARNQSPRCSDCTFADDVSYVRNRATGELSALVAIALSMEVSDRSARNDGDAVGNLQLGTAVFRFDGDHWETDGKAILNLSPSEAIRFYRKELEKVGEELAHH
jgi:hypothetical protein